LAVPRILGFSCCFKSARASSIRSLWVDLSMVEDGGGKCKNSSSWRDFLYVARARINTARLDHSLPLSPSLFIFDICFILSTSRCPMSNTSHPRRWRKAREQIDRWFMSIERVYHPQACPRWSFLQCSNFEIP
jgi:hypothetical protein